MLCHPVSVPQLVPVHTVPILCLSARHDLGILRSISKQAAQETSLRSGGGSRAARRSQHRSLQHPGAHIHGQQFLTQLGTGLGETRHRSHVAQTVAGLCRLALSLLQLLQGKAGGQVGNTDERWAINDGGRFLLSWKHTLCVHQRT